MDRGKFVALVMESRSKYKQALSAVMDDVQAPFDYIYTNQATATLYLENFTTIPVHIKLYDCDIDHETKDEEGYSDLILISSQYQQVILSGEWIL